MTVGAAPRGTTNRSGELSLPPKQPSRPARLNILHNVLSSLYYKGDALAR